MSQPRKYDRRLIGTWQSDRRRTFRNFKPNPQSTPQQFRKLKALFGKMRVRWTRTKVYSSSDGIDWTSDRYEIVASDWSSVVVRYRSPIVDEDVLQQIHFSDGYYYLCLGMGGGLVEWFKRIK